VVGITVLISEPGINQPKDAASICENPARIARVTKSDRKAQSIVVAPMLACGCQVSASQEASAVLVPDHYPCIVTRSVVFFSTFLRGDSAC
jgi:hypothetical protein